MDTIENDTVDVSKYGSLPRMIPHPSQDRSEYGYDSAILEYPKDVDLGIKPVKLAKDYKVTDNDKVIAAGYGAIHFDVNGMLFLNQPITLYML